MQQLELIGRVERRVLMLTDLSLRRPPLLVIAIAGPLIVQSWPVLAQMTVTEQALADKINCDEWKKNQNGSWISKPGTKIGSYSFSNTTVAPGDWSLDGADFGTVLNKKCTK
jgi:hypothetical protein